MKTGVLGAGLDGASPGGNGVPPFMSTQALTAWELSIQLRIPGTPQGMLPSATAVPAMVACPEAAV